MNALFFFLFLGNVSLSLFRSIAAAQICEMYQADFIVVGFNWIAVHMLKLIIVARLLFSN